MSRSKPGPRAPKAAYQPAVPSLLLNDDDDDDDDAAADDDNNDNDDDDDDDPDSCGCIITEFDQKLVLLSLCLVFQTCINMTREGIDLSS